MTRLTKALKDQILNAIIADSKFSALKDPMKSKAKELLLEFHKDNQPLFKKALELQEECINTIPKEYRSSYAFINLIEGEKLTDKMVEIRYQPDGQIFLTSIAVSVDEGEILPRFTRLNEYPEYNKRMNKALQESRELSKNRQTFINKVSSMLDSVTTIKKFVNTYPRFEKYVPADVVKAVPTKIDVKEVMKELM